jgi:hypothetical protein
MEAALISVRDRRLFLTAASYCTLDLAFHYFGLIEGLSSALHVPSVWFFFIAEAGFTLAGAVLIRKMWSVRRPMTLGQENQWGQSCKMGAPVKLARCSG